MARKRKLKLAQAHALKLGTLQIRKGVDEEGYATYTWDVSSPCTHEDCPAYSKCHYEPRVGEDGECKVLKSYLRSAAVVLYESNKEMTAAQRYQIGMHILPMYRILCRMKIEEIGVERVSYRDDKGIFRVNPLYKEIRETIKAIDAIWKSIGVKASEQPSTQPDLGFAGNNYYDAMEKSAFADSKVTPIRGKKK